MKLEARRNFTNHTKFVKYGLIRECESKFNTPANSQGRWKKLLIASGFKNYL